MTLKKLLTFIFLFATFLINAQQKIKHKVVQGESVYSIAKKYNVTEKEIFDLNPKAKGVLALDMELIIPKVSKKKEETKKVVVPKGNSYTVQNGESFYTISRKFNVGYETLTELNAEIKPINKYIIWLFKAYRLLRLIQTLRQVLEIRRLLHSCF
jgi:LysM repeat protein